MKLLYKYLLSQYLNDKLNDKDRRGFSTQLVRTKYYYKIDKNNIKILEYLLLTHILTSRAQNLVYSYQMKLDCLCMIYKFDFRFGKIN